MQLTLLLWYPDIHSRVYKSLVYVLNQFNVGYTLYPIISGYIGVAAIAVSADAPIILPSSTYTNTHLRIWGRGIRYSKYMDIRLRKCSTPGSGIYSIKNMM